MSFTCSVKRQKVDLSSQFGENGNRWNAIRDLAPLKIWLVKPPIDYSGFFTGRSQSETGKHFDHRSKPVLPFDPGRCSE